MKPSRNFTNQTIQSRTLSISGEIEVVEITSQLFRMHEIETSWSKAATMTQMEYQSLLFNCYRVSMRVIQKITNKQSHPDNSHRVKSSLMTAEIG